MREDENMRIRLEIAEKPYNLTIKRSEEEMVRRAAKSIKEQIGELRRKHDASLVEYLSMAALLISIENETNKGKLASSKELRDLESLVEDLNEYLEAEQK